MSADNDDGPVQGHEYDGIHELDNPLPSWWMTTFFITIIFSFLYWIHYEFGGGQTQDQELKADLATIESIRKKAPEAELGEAEINALLASAEAKALGKAAYDAKCAACHGPELQGLIGPNLTDEYWLHGRGTLPDVISTVKKGVPDKGMPPWEGLLKPDEIKAVAVFILAQSGSNPPNAKPPQGEKIVRN